MNRLPEIGERCVFLPVTRVVARVEPYRGQTCEVRRVNVPQVWLPGDPLVVPTEALVRFDDGFEAWIEPRHLSPE